MRATILVVDDDPGVCDLIEELLEAQAGWYLVLKAHDGMQAWQIMQDRPVDLVVTDAEMPRLAGLELTKRIRARWKKLPIIMMSGSYTRAERAVAEKSGITTFLRKPFDNRTFITVVQAILRPRRAEPEAPAVVALTDRHRVLVAEDDDAVRGILRHLLEDAGFQVVEARDGEEAVLQLQRNRPDLVLLDLKLPRIDGFKLCRIIKDHPGLKDIPVVVCSARDQREDVVRAVREGAVDYIIKPFKHEELLARVRKALAARQRVPVGSSVSSAALGGVYAEPKQKTPGSDTRLRRVIRDSNVAEPETPAPPKAPVVPKTRPQPRKPGSDSRLRKVTPAPAKAKAPGSGSRLSVVKPAGKTPPGPPPPEKGPPANVGVFECTLADREYLDDDVAIVQIFGSLETKNVSFCEKVITDQISAGRKKLIIDLSGLNWSIQQADDLGKIVATAKENGGSARIVSPDPDVRQVLVRHRIHASLAASVKDALSDL